MTGKASIPVGHVSVRGELWDDHKEYARFQQIGGSYGFALIGLDDGRLVARLVNPGTPAALAGMKFGAEMLEVNDRPVNEVLDTVSFEILQPGGYGYIKLTSEPGDSATMAKVYTDTTLYEQQSYYNPGSGMFEMHLPLT